MGFVLVLVTQRADSRMALVSGQISVSQTEGTLDLIILAWQPLDTENFKFSATLFEFHKY